jgi:hypothetical protein
MGLKYHFAMAAVAALALAGCGGAAPSSSGDVPSAGRGLPAPAAALPPSNAQPRHSGPPVTKPSEPQSQAPQSRQASAKPSGKPSGQLVFDPFDAIVRTWVPRMLVDLSAGAKPGIDIRVPPMASQVDTQVTA